MEKSTPSSPQPEYRKNPNRYKYDQPIYGLLAGVVFIFLGVLGIKFLRHPEMSIAEYFSIFTTFENSYMLSEGSKILSLALFVLLAPFYFFLNKNSYMATRGVLIVAMIVAAFIILYKFIL